MPEPPAGPEGRVALTGASGTVGEFVGRHLLEAGYAITALLRSKQVPDWLQAAEEQGRARLVHGPLSGIAPATPILEALLNGADACIHCAFSHLPGRYRQGEGDDPVAFWQDNLLGTLALLESCLTAGVERALLFSSRAVFDGYAEGLTEPLWLDDDASPRPTTHYGALKTAEEALVARYATETALCVTALRPTGVFGLRAEAAKSKWFPLIADLQHGILPTPRAATEVHGDDLATAAQLLLGAERKKINGRIFNCADLLLSHRTIVELFNGQTGRTLSLPAEGNRPLLRQRCSGLDTLGWQPTGLAHLETTLDGLRSATATSAPD